MTVRKVTSAAELDRLYIMGRDTFDPLWQCSPRRTYPERDEFEARDLTVYASYDNGGMPEGFTVLRHDGFVHWLRFNPQRARQVVKAMADAILADGYPAIWGVISNDFVRNAALSFGCAPYPEAGRPDTVRWSG